MNFSSFGGWRMAVPIVETQNLSGKTTKSSACSKSDAAREKRTDGADASQVLVRHWNHRTSQNSCHHRTIQKTECLGNLFWWTRKQSAFNLYQLITLYTYPSETKTWRARGEQIWNWNAEGHWRCWMWNMASEFTVKSRYTHDIPSRIPQKPRA